MNVVAGQGRSRPILRVFDSAPRIRPGETPVWVDSAVGTDEGHEWRRRARACGIGLDAWLSVLVEFQVVSGPLEQGELNGDGVRAAAIQAAGEARLAPTDALRRWVKLLSGQRAATDLVSDELPTVVLPERLLAQLAGARLNDALRAATTEVDERLALTCERVAAERGLTLESWMLRAVAGLPADGV